MCLSQTSLSFDELSLIFAKRMTLRDDVSGPTQYALISLWWISRLNILVVNQYVHTPCGESVCLSFLWWFSMRNLLMVKSMLNILIVNQYVQAPLGESVCLSLLWWIIMPDLFMMNKCAWSPLEEANGYHCMSYVSIIIVKFICFSDRQVLDVLRVTDKA